MFIAWNDFMFHVVVYCCYGHGRIMKPWAPWPGRVTKIHCFQPQNRDTFKPPLILTNTKSKNN